MTVYQLLSSLDSKELSEWMAYFRMQPKPERPLTVDEQVETSMKGYARFK